MEWRRVEQFPDYEVNARGVVRRVRFAPPSKPGRILRGSRDQIGRVMFKLRDVRGVPRKVLAHRLVAAAFLNGNVFAGPLTRDTLLCCHRDGDYSNNSDGNLYYGTQKENMADRERHGRTPRGETNGRAKLTTEQVREIRRRRRAGEQRKRLADEFGVTGTLVRLIAQGRIWRSVEA